MSEENIEKIKALLEPFYDAEITGIDWEGEAIREILEAGLLARHRAEDAGVGYWHRSKQLLQGAGTV